MKFENWGEKLHILYIYLINEVFAAFAKVIAHPSIILWELVRFGKLTKDFLLGLRNVFPSVL